MRLGRKVQLVLLKMLLEMRLGIKLIIPHFYGDAAFMGRS